MLKNHRKYLNLTWLIILTIVPLPLVITLKQGLPFIFQRDILQISFGLVAYVWMLSVIYLSTKPKYLDNLLGLPDMYLIHGVLSIFALVLLYLHKFLSPSVGLIETTGEVSLYMYTAVIVYSLVFLAGWLTSRIKILNDIKKFLERIFKHEITIWLHRLNVLATIIGFVHVLLIDYIVNIKPFFILFTIYFAFTFVSYGIFVIKSFKNRIGKVNSVKPISKDMVELIIDCKAEDLKDIKAGDFVYISFDKKGLKERHPFSIQNNPQSENKIKFAIEKVGDFTRSLESLEIGEKAYFTKGYGVLNKFVKNHKGKVVFLGGGAGVVPLVSMAEAFEDKGILFLYTAKKEKGFIYEEEFAKWNERENFKSVLQLGRFKDEQLREILPIDKDTLYIIAGPMKMNIAYTNYLKKNGIKSNQIYFESFNF